MDAKPDELIPDEIMESIDDEVPFWPGQAVGVTFLESRLAFCPLAEEREYPPETF